MRIKCNKSRHKNKANWCFTVLSYKMQPVITGISVSHFSVAADVIRQCGKTQAAKLHMSKVLFYFLLTFDIYSVMVLVVLGPSFASTLS